MEIERMTRLWTVKLGRIVRYHTTPKVMRHARESTGAIMELNEEVPTKKYFTRGPFDPGRWTLQAHERWRRGSETGNQESHAVDKITQSNVENDVLGSPNITTA